MNFPGLGPTWTGVHHGGHALGFFPTWSLDETRAAIDQGDKVLVVATTALGDSLLTTPLLETLSTRLGPGRVSLLVKRPYVDLYRSDPRLHCVFSIRGKFRWNNLGSELKADPHRIALLSNITEPDLIPYLWHCGVRGFLRYNTRWTEFNKWIADPTMLRAPGESGYATGHAIENNLAMARALGLEPTTHRLSLPHFQSEKVPPNDAEAPKNPTVLIHPGASRENKCWPVERWARLGDQIAAEFNCLIAITGDKSEVPRAEAVKAAMKLPAQVVAGTLPLPALATLQTKSLAFLSGDTGPYHLAVAVVCPTMTLFAPTDRGSSMEACGPHQADPRFHRALQTANFSDSISTLSYEQVWSEVEKLLTDLRS